MSRIQFNLCAALKFECHPPVGVYGHSIDNGCTFSLARRKANNFPSNSQEEIHLRS